VRHRVTQLLHVVHVPQQYLVVDGGPELARFEKMNRVQVGDVDAPGVRRRTLGSVLLDVHPEKAHVDAVYFLESEQSFRPVGELRRQLSSFDKFTPHPRLHFDRFFRTRHHSYRDLAGPGFLLLQEVVDARLYVHPQFRNGKPLRVELVIASLRPLLLQAFVAGESLRPDVFVVQHAYLVQLPAAVGAMHERLHLQVVVFHLLELIFLDRRLGLSRVIT
jgi:hypothetical protein